MGTDFLHLECIGVNFEVGVVLLEFGVMLYAAKTKNLIAKRDGGMPPSSEVVSGFLGGLHKIGLGKQLAHYKLNIKNDNIDY